MTTLEQKNIYEKVRTMYEGKGGEDYVGPEPSKGLKRIDLAGKWSEWYGKHENRKVKKSYSDGGGNL
ncbi:MAG: hypothetical protein PVJ67_00910 [Candidatus Pacearchaeota archaeon]|jgi:hypothetical protein